MEQITIKSFLLFIIYTPNKMMIMALQSLIKMISFANSAPINKDITGGI